MKHWLLSLAYALFAVSVAPAAVSRSLPPPAPVVEGTVLEIVPHLFHRDRWSHRARVRVDKSWRGKVGEIIEINYSQFPYRRLGVKPLDHYRLVKGARYRLPLYHRHDGTRRFGGRPALIVEGTVLRKRSGSTCHQTGYFDARNERCITFRLDKDRRILSAGPIEVSCSDAYSRATVWDSNDPPTLVEGVSYKLYVTDRQPYELLYRPVLLQEPTGMKAQPARLSPSARGCACRAAPASNGSVLPGALALQLVLLGLRLRRRD